MTRSRLFVTALLWGSLTAQAAEETGAKGLFVDQLSKASVPAGHQVTKTKLPATAVAQKPVNTGLMYYLELVKPSGEVLRVNSNREFRSGEKVRLHFTSNINGRLAIVQRNADGTSNVLFPDARVRGGDNRIRAGEDTVVPSEHAWFTFDDNPGQEKLMVFLTTDGGYESIKPVLAQSSLDGEKTLQLASNINTHRGSKALKLEVDNTGPQPATYTVMSSVAPREGSTPAQTAPPVLAMEIVLTHK